MFVDDVLETQVEEDNSAVECNCSPVACLQDPAAFTNIAGLRSSDGCKDGVIFLSQVRCERTKVCGLRSDIPAQ
jgi:hypothetical protein